MNISGRFILYGPLVILIIIFLYKYFNILPENVQNRIIDGFIVLYIIYNIAGLLALAINHSEEGSQVNKKYQYNFDNYIYKVEVKDKNNNIVTNKYNVTYYYNESFPIFRIGSILCWIVYVWYHIDRYFSNLIIKI